MTQSADSREHTFDRIDGETTFRGLTVCRRDVRVSDRSIQISAVKDPADLLDQPDYAERFVREDRAPYGLELWPAARMLADYLLGPQCRSPQRCPVGTAIELGCGLGLVSIAAALAGWQVTATDHDPDALHFARHNARVNHATIHAFELLDWRSPPPRHTYDVVLAADVLYQLVDHAPLLRCVDALLAPRGTALVADPNRSLADRFPAMAAEHEFTVGVAAAQATDYDDRVTHGRIFTLSRSANVAANST